MLTGSIPSIHVSHLQQTHLSCEWICYYYCFALNNEKLNLSPRYLFTRLLLMKLFLLWFFSIWFTIDHILGFPIGKQCVLHLFGDGLESLGLDLFFEAWNHHLNGKLSSEQYIKPQHLLKNCYQHRDMEPHCIHKHFSKVHFMAKYLFFHPKFLFNTQFYSCLISGLED